jgi:glycosyltransferase involved in cell wall biosynthesis
MRVVLTCDWFLKYSASQAAALARTGVQVVLLCRAHAFEFGGDARERAETLDAARMVGVRVIELPRRHRDPAAFESLIRIRRSLSRFRPDVIHAHEGADPRALALLPRAPIVLTVHDPTPHPGQPIARQSTKRWFLKRVQDAWRARARLIIVHSAYLRGEVPLRGDQRCAVVPHGLELYPEPLPPPSIPAVGFFGRLEPYKGLTVLASAMPRVWAERPEVQLRIAGSGPVQLPLRDRRVSIDRSYLPEAAFEQFFRSVSLAVLPYTEASQSGAGSTAVGYGIPIVVSRLGGLPDLALDDTYVVEPGDEGSLAAGIMRHIDDGVEARAQVREQVAAPRTWDSAATLTVSLYEDLRAG